MLHLRTGYRDLNVVLQQGSDLNVVLQQGSGLNVVLRPKCCSFGRRKRYTVV